MKNDASKKLSRRQVIAASAGALGVATLATRPAAAQRPKRNGLQGKKVLVCVGEFSEGMETYYMVFRLMEEGIKPVVAAKDVKLLQMVVHDFDPCFSNYIEMQGYKIEINVAYADVKPGDYDGLLIPGGRGPEEIRQYQEVLDLVGYFMDKKLPLGAMCHGPQVLWAARPVKGRKMTCYYGIRPDLELAGATFIDEASVTDGMLVTSRGWPDLFAFMPQFLDVLAQA
jgi:protease I